MTSTLDPTSLSSEISPPVTIDVKEEYEWTIKEESIEIFTLPEDFPDNFSPKEQDEVLVPVFTCVGCFLVFNNSISLERHELFCRLKTGISVEATTTTTGQDVPHQETAMSGAVEQSVSIVTKSTTKDGFLMLPCWVCGKMLRDSRCLEEHMLLRASRDNGLTCNGIKIANLVYPHRNDSAFKCEICPGTFNSKFSRDRHMKTHSKEKLFHKLSYAVEKRFGCALCPKRFASKSYSVLHLRLHTGEKPFSCGVCDARFVSKCGLANHARTHSGERPFSCGACDARYRSRSGLAYHVTTHSGEKPFVCALCQAMFALNGSLTRHMKSHTGGKSYACSMCPLIFTREYLLIRHQITGHYY